MTLPASPLRDALTACAAPLEAPTATGAPSATGVSSATGVPNATGAAQEKTAAWRRTYCFPASALVFAGHFPGQPVLPAVVQTLMAQMTVEAAVAAVGAKVAVAAVGAKAAVAAVREPAVAQKSFPRLLAVTQAKFTAVLGPDMPITVHARPAAKPGHWDCTLHADATPHSEATLAAKIQLHMEMPPDTAPHEQEAHA